VTRLLDAAWSLLDRAVTWWLDNIESRPVVTDDRG
jgi:hypothetical protein